jgi:hypothetical protein
VTVGFDSAPAFASQSAIQAETLPALARPCALAYTRAFPNRHHARARSSAGEHYLDTVGVTGSIPVAPTMASESRSFNHKYEL